MECLLARRGLPGGREVGRAQDHRELRELRDVREGARSRGRELRRRGPPLALDAVASPAGGQGAGGWSALQAASRVLCGAQGVEVCLAYPASMDVSSSKLTATFGCP